MEILADLGSHVVVHVGLIFLMLYTIILGVLVALAWFGLSFMLSKLAYFSI